MGHKLTLEMRIDDDVYTPRIPDSLTIKELNSKLLKHLKQKTGKDVNLAGLQVKKERSTEIIHCKKPWTASLDQ